MMWSDGGERKNNFDNTIAEITTAQFLCMYLTAQLAEKKRENFELWQSNSQNKNLNLSNPIAKNRRDKIFVVAHIKLLLQEKISKRKSPAFSYNQI